MTLTLIGDLLVHLTPLKSLSSFGSECLGRIIVKIRFPNLVICISIVPKRKQLFELEVTRIIH